MVTCPAEMTMQHPSTLGVGHLLPLSIQPPVALPQKICPNGFLADVQDLHSLNTMVFWKKCLVKTTQHLEQSG